MLGNLLSRVAVLAVGELGGVSRRLAIIRLMCVGGRSSEAAGTFRRGK
jgi:hypothetical protein